MKLGTLDHINLRTRNLDRLVDWYERVLGMRKGPRPGFSFPGAWLYVGDQSYVHLVGVDRDLPAQQDDIRLEHFAMSATGLAEFLSHLEETGIACKLVKVPDFPIVQVNIWDPDGNHVHIDFHSDEAEALDLP